MEFLAAAPVMFQMRFLLLALVAVSARADDGEFLELVVGNALEQMGEAGFLDELFDFFVRDAKIDLIVENARNTVLKEVGEEFEKKNIHWKENSAMLSVGLDGVKVGNLSTIQLVGDRQSLTQASPTTWNYDLTVGLGDFYGQTTLTYSSLFNKGTIVARIHATGSSAKATGQIIVDNGSCSGTLGSAQVVDTGKTRIEAISGKLSPLVATMVEEMLDVALVVEKPKLNQLLEEAIRTRLPQDKMSAILCPAVTVN